MRNSARLMGVVLSMCSNSSVVVGLSGRYDDRVVEGGCPSERTGTEGKLPLRSCSLTCPPCLVRGSGLGGHQERGVRMGESPKARDLYDALRALERRARTAYNKQHSQKYSRRETARSTEGHGSSFDRRLGEWLNEDWDKAKTPDPSSSEQLIAVVQQWSEWAGEPCDEGWWRTLLDQAQRPRSPLPPSPVPEPVLSGSDGEWGGRPIEEWDPHDLEVHPAADLSGSTHGHRRGPSRTAVLPEYVRRPHDGALADVVAAAELGTSGMVVLTGSSSTGKTRACWEALQSLAGTGWRLWHPFDPTHTEAALAGLARVKPRTVIWLNEAQHYVGDESGKGERVASALHALLADPARGPVLVLGTLWPDRATVYTSRPAPGGSDRHARTRELLAGRLIPVPEQFDELALEQAARLAAAGDPYLADTLPRAKNGRVTQDLAGAPELLQRYDTASPPAQALLSAAMDARRLGASLHLPWSFLVEAAQDYLTDEQFGALDDGWEDQARDELGRPVHGDLSPLRRVRPRSTHRSFPPGYVTVSGLAGPLYRLADYLEQHGRDKRRLLCPPESFWQAALRHFDSVALRELARAAGRRERLRWEHRLYLRAADTGDARALYHLTDRLAKAGKTRAAEARLKPAADAGHSGALARLAILREQAGRQTEAEELAVMAAEASDSTVLLELAGMRAEAGNEPEAQRLCDLAVTFGHTPDLELFAEIQEEARHPQEELFYQAAADAGGAYSLLQLACRSQRAGKLQEAERLYHLVADADDDSCRCSALHSLAEISEKAGKREEAEHLALSADATGNLGFSAVSWLAHLRSDAGDEAEAERLYRRAADAGDHSAARELANIRENVGDHDEAETWAHLADGHGSMLCGLANRRLKAGCEDDAERLYRLAAEAGDTTALVHIAERHAAVGEQTEADRILQRVFARHGTAHLDALVADRLRAGKKAEAERMYRVTAEAGNTHSMIQLAKMRHAEGDDTEAERLYMLAVDSRDHRAVEYIALRLEKAGKPYEAEHLVMTTSDDQFSSAVLSLADFRGKTGDTAALDRLARKVADAGYTSTLAMIAESWGTPSQAKPARYWPHGLETDGRPSAPWSDAVSQDP